MTRCGLQRGVFALRPCPNESLFICQSCNRPACGEHTARSTPPECAECAARREEQERLQQPSGMQTATRGAPGHRWRDDDDGLWGFSYRYWLWTDAVDTGDDRLGVEAGAPGDLDVNPFSGGGEIDGDEAGFDDTDDGGEFGDS